MLRICSSALVTGCDLDLLNQIRIQTAKHNIKLEVRKEWLQLSKTEAERFICTPKVFFDINPKYYPITVMCVSKGIDITPFLKAGITRFITDVDDEIQFLQAMFVEYEAKKERKRFLIDYVKGDYRFLFTRDEFYYKGEGIYLLPNEKKYLYDWLIFKDKDNKKRIALFTIRKRLEDKSFMKDIDRFGGLVNE